jgi:hypothetical protein
MAPRKAPARGRQIVKAPGKFLSLPLKYTMTDHFQNHYPRLPQTRGLRSAVLFQDRGLLAGSKKSLILTILRAPLVFPSHSTRLPYPQGKKLPQSNTNIAQNQRLPFPSKIRSMSRQPTMRLLLQASQSHRWIILWPPRATDLL